MLLQWNLRITDTFGTHCFPVILSFVERLSFIGGLECTKTIGKSPFGTLKLVLCSEVISFVSLIRSVSYSECPLSEVPL